LNSEYKQDFSTDEEFLKFWAKTIDKRDSLNKQIEDYEKSYNQQIIDNLRQIKDSEKKYFNIFKELIVLITGKRNE